MALPPTIPTSFVPYSASADARRSRTGYAGALDVFAYSMLCLSVALALGVFAYGLVLGSTKEKKDTALRNAEAAIDPITVKNFVHLRNRLSISQSLLASHVAFSNFFSALEKMLPATARLSNLHLVVDTTGTIHLDASGTAKSFNVLASVSKAFADDGQIKDAIFSNIVVDQKDTSVSFTLKATIDQKLIAFSPVISEAEVPAPPATTTTPAP